MTPVRSKKPKTFGTTVYVEEGKPKAFERALRKLKNKLEDSGLFKELRERQQYEKPSVRRKLAKNAAKRRWKKKLAAQQLPVKHY